jgi:hypothetical protein
LSDLKLDKDYEAPFPSRSYSSLSGEQLEYFTTDRSVRSLVDPVERAVPPVIYNSYQVVTLSQISSMTGTKQQFGKLIEPG